MSFSNVSKELLAYFESKKFLAVPLSIANIILFACVIIRALNLFIRIDATILAIVFYLFFFSIVLLLAKEDYMSLAIGLGGHAVVVLLRMIIIRFIGVPSILEIIIYGAFAFVAFSKTTTKVSSPTLEKEAVKCPSCGSPLDENVAFCNSCGHKV